MGATIGLRGTGTGTGTGGGGWGLGGGTQRGDREELGKSHYALGPRGHPQQYR
jgi:hypothetical protein